MRTSSIGVPSGSLGPLHGGPDRDPAELDGRDAGQRAAELADRGPGRADDVDVAVRAGRRSLGHGADATPRGRAISRVPRASRR